ncbi:hypothetical protein [Leptospira koniambonensis]|uniref:hypothetical protein n=1 Tax=Leptospira koniambonensis TaxID=2484950 RepID=UPI003EC09CE9
MKYFTYDWWFGENVLDYDPSVKYWEYYDSIKNSLPHMVRTFVDEINLHDSRELELERDVKNNSILIKLLTYKYDENFSSDSQFVIHILYSDVSEFAIFDNEIESNLIEFDPNDDLGYDEFEMLGGDITAHRLLFSSGIEIRVNFRGFSYSVGDVFI